MKIVLTSTTLVLLLCGANALFLDISSHPYRTTSVAPKKPLGFLFSTVRHSSYDPSEDRKDTIRSFDESVNLRYACKRFLRYDECENSAGTIQKKTETVDARYNASLSNPNIVECARICAELSRRAPSSFNTQPYKIVLVHSQSQKEALSKHCLALNGQRVLDSDCTAVFLADKQVCRTFAKFRQEMAAANAKRWSLLKLQFYITLFSSGYPLPRFLSAPLSFLVRSVVGVLHVFTRLFRFPLPSLGNAETWAARQTMMIAMTYILACSSRNLATIPMEGFNARGIRQVVGASGRYAVPVIVATGLPYYKEPERYSKRYNSTEILFSNRIGEGFGQSVE